MSETVTASNGVALPIDSLEMVFSYNEAGNVDTITVVYAGITYVQTFGYTDGSVSSISQWEAQ